MKRSSRRDSRLPTTRAWCAGVGLFFAVGAHTRTAVAQPADREVAQSHFERGRSHVKAGRCDLAIEEFKTSIDFEPNSVGARLNLGDCYVTLERLPEAFRQFKEAEALAVRTQDARLEDARRSAARITAKLVRVVVREADPPAPDVIVTVDGASAGARPWTIVVEPNTVHSIEASAPDGSRWSETVNAGAGEVVRITLTLRAPPDTARPAGTEVPTPARQDGHALQTTGLIVGGVGASGLVTGVVFGVLAHSARSDLADAVARDRRCSGGYPAGSCDPAAKGELAPIERRAFLASTVSTVALIAGGALLGAGTILFIVGRPEQGRQGLASIRLGTGVFVDGTF